MKQPILLSFILWMTIQIGWTQNNTTTIAYIAQFKAIAMKEMKRTGVPASITLAQGILESNSGQSYLATNHNNHFGIKCKSDWTGAKAYQDDDAKQECFRAYEAAELSFKDHSNFLKNRPNYVALFLLDPVDDTAWAYGLKKAGYATAPDYPKKLLKIIDDYELAQYNFPELANEIDSDEEEDEDEEVKTPSLPTKALPKELLPAPQTAFIKKDTIKQDTIQRDVNIGVQTTQTANAPIDTTKKTTTSEFKSAKQPSYNYPEGRFRINQVPVILGKENVSFLEIAIKYNLPLYKLFEYNEMNASNLLERDQLIFLAPKKKAGATSFHNVQYTTSLHEISQLEGVQLSLLKLYNPQLKDPIKEGTQVVLFKRKDENAPNKKDNSLLFTKRKK